MGLKKLEKDISVWESISQCLHLVTTAVTMTVTSRVTTSETTFFRRAHSEIYLEVKNLLLTPKDLIICHEFPITLLATLLVAVAVTVTVTVTAALIVVKYKCNQRINYSQVNINHYTFVLVSTLIQLKNNTSTHFLKCQTSMRHFLNCYRDKNN